LSDIFNELTNSLLGIEEETAGLAHAVPDFHRESRKGIPEIIYAERKHPEDTIAIAHRFLVEGSGRAIISRANPELRARLIKELNPLVINLHEIALDYDEYPASNTLVLRRADHVRPQTGGRVGIITAGTSDIPIAEEAAVIAREMGCEVTNIYDVGVAGLHRLFRPLQTMLGKEVDTIIVAAGMDGALPSVIAGLVTMPVIGLPTSVGYGMGGKGVAALLSMLQTCAPGLTVVNIDNGVGAGATAALLANRMAAARGENPKETKKAKLLLEIRPITPQDKDWVKAYIKQEWGAEFVVVHGERYFPAELPGFVALQAGERVGLITYRVRDKECEIVSLNSLKESQGIGTQLIDYVKLEAQQAGCVRVWLITTNDNVDALRFYQQRGFNIAAIHKNAVTTARQLKPTIPLLGKFGIAITDEIELQLWLG
jgi:NCAIR mutase (PurE)-related protein/ribosomal protein S18 acetylase RimI-like enzyme